MPIDAHCRQREHDMPLAMSRLFDDEAARHETAAAA